MSSSINIELNDETQSNYTRHGFKYLTVIAVPFFLLFSFFDIELVPEYATQFISLRFLASIIYLVVFYATYKIKSFNFLMFGSIFAGLLPCVFTAYMVSLTGGADSVYLTGALITATTVFMSLFLPTIFGIFFIIISSFSLLIAVLIPESSDLPHKILAVSYILAQGCFLAVYGLIVEKIRRDVQVREHEFDSLKNEECLRLTVPKRIREEAKEGKWTLNKENYFDSMAVLFADLSGSTAFGQIAPKPLFSKIKIDFFNLCVKLGGEHGVLVPKFLGDGVLLVANYNNPMWEEKLVRFMQELFASWEEYINDIRGEFHVDQLGIRIGGSMGPASLGFFGSDEQFDFTPDGQEVHVASRISSAAEQGEVVLTGRLFYSIRNHFRDLKWDFIERDDLRSLEGMKMGLFKLNFKESQETKLKCSVCQSPLIWRQNRFYINELVCPQGHEDI
ncbi:MAG: adenylate/guanylate cyclase domain-containing protein [Oligoflexales bacterium]